MRQYETLKVVQEGDVVTAFLDRPDARNAINMRMVNELSHLIDAIDDAKDVSVLVLRGSPDVFTSGIDLHEFAAHEKRNIYGLQKWEQVCRELERLKKFTVAAVQGECTGGGFQLALSCDARERGERAKDQWGLENLRVGYGIEPEDARKAGLYISEGRGKDEPQLFTEPAVLLVKPGDGTLYAAWVQSQPRARPHFEEVLAAADKLIERGLPAPRGSA